LADSPGQRLTAVRQATFGVLADGWSVQPASA
jgi:hypothetical protein